jgi:FdhD protein
VSETTRRGIARAPAVVIADGGGLSRIDEVVVEEPLEIRVAGDPIATTMRTPGDDRFLAVGFLFAEGILPSLDDVGSVSHCGRPGEAGYGHTIEVVPAPGAKLDWDKIDGSRRSTLVTSACGVCGRASIDDLVQRLATLAPPPHRAPIPAALIARTPEFLRAEQENFARTGGLHAAAAITRDGRVVAAAEDVGRHNAVDKVVGKLLYAGALPRTQAEDAPALLAVSGRASFEIMQKAAVAGFAGVASVSAASSLAIATAAATGIALAAFVRAGRFTLYSHPEAVTYPP